MSGVGCTKAMRLVERVESGLDEAERLRLEDHLESCARCAEDATLLAVIGRVTRSLAPLDDVARARALSRAFANKPAQLVRTASVEHGRRRGVPKALLFAAAFTFGLLGLISFLLLRPRAPIVASSVTPDASGEAVSPVETELSEGTTLVLPHASVTALGPSRLRWDEATTTLRVLEGELRVEVEPDRPAPFRVEMERYTVEVLGTIFEVRASSVSVERGRVRVLSRDGSTTPVELAAGDRWSAPVASVAPETSASDPEIATSASASASSKASKTRGDPSVVFARARKLLASGDAPRAKRLVEGALASGLGPGQEAEAKTLLAECALVGGDTKEAARRYAEVANQHKDLPAGETALFAAARTAHNAGQKDDARRLFRQYLDRYPQGTFASEARARLAQLSP